MDQNEKVEDLFFDTPLIFKIKNAARDFFDSWRQNAKLNYPDHEFFADDIEIEANMKQSFYDGVSSLFREENQYKRIIPGWSIGYVLGYVQSNLDTRWCHEYIFTKTEEFKELLLLKAIRNYFELELSSIEKVFMIFSYFRDQIECTDDVIYKSENVIFLKEYDKFNNIEIDEFKTFTLKYLVSIHQNNLLI